MKYGLWIAICCFLLLTVSTGQKPGSKSKSKLSADSSTRLIEFNVSGTSRYNDKEILAASGLQIGRNANEADFKEGVQRLGASGMFVNAAYTYSISNNGTKLQLRLADIEGNKLVPARFENLVWFSDDQLVAEVRKSVPLFKGLLPLTGALPDHVSEALRALLSEHQLPGRADFLRSTEANSSTLSEIVYRVEEVSIRIESVEFPGASPEHKMVLESAARKLIGEEYGRSTFEAAAKFDLLPVYFQRGYLKASFGESSARVIDPSRENPPTPEADSTVDRTPASTTEVRVAAILPVKPGDLYVSSGIEVTGNAAIKTEQILALLHLNAGQPADSIRLQRDTENIGRLYRSRGFMTANIKADPQFDDAKQAVRYTIKVVEGDLYKMGELDILGLDNQTKAKMEEAWTLREGQPYNAEYPKKFIESAQRLLPSNEWDIKVEETPDARDKTVDVAVRFKQR